jgi:ribosomal protein S27AE
LIYIKNLINNEIPLQDYLKDGSKISSNKLKLKLYKYNVKKRICEKCGQGEEWNGERMSLILDHINGIPNDNRIENLRILCPNCNATLPTHCKGSKFLK